MEAPARGSALNALIEPAQGERPATKPTLVSCEKLPHVSGKSVTTVLVHFPPDGFSPRHRHAGSVTAYVLKGTVRSQLNDGPIGTFTVGQSFFEPPGTIHTFAENASKTEPAEILATFVADDCAQLTTYLDRQRCLPPTAERWLMTVTTSTTVTVTMWRLCRSFPMIYTEENRLLGSPSPRFACRLRSTRHAYLSDR
jgi:quercetin dioxygenase-like cupin family protein